MNIRTERLTYVLLLDPIYEFFNPNIGHTMIGKSLEIYIPSSAVQAYAFYSVRYPELASKTELDSCAKTDIATFKEHIKVKQQFLKVNLSAIGGNCESILFISEQ